MPDYKTLLVCAIHLDDTIDWGVEYTEDEYDRYEQLVADAIARAYPDARVTVQGGHRIRPRALVTMRDADGRIIVDDSGREGEIEAHAVAIAAKVWDAGKFWK